MRRNSLRKLLLANFSGRIVYAISSLAALPLLEKYIGVEGVGLVGFFNTLLMVMMVLEGGLTSNVINLIAKVNSKAALSARYVLYGFQITNSYLVAFLILGLICVIGVHFSSSFLATKWLEVDNVPASEVVASVRWMGIFIGANFIVIAAQAVLIGREMQVPLNVLYIVFSLSRTLGMVVFFWAVENSAGPLAYFKLQVLCQFAYLIGLLALIYGRKQWRVFLQAKPSFRFFVDGSSYSRDILLLSLTSMIVVQFDKFYLSGSVPLTEFAAYTLAATMANFPYVISSSLYSVLFPRFTVQLDIGCYQKVDDLYRAALCGVAIIMSVLCVSVWLFSIHPLRLMFSRDLANDIYNVLPVLILGVSIQSLLMVPFALQLASRWSALALRMNLFLVPIFITLLPVLVERYGALGAAYAWLFYNISSLIGINYFVFKRFRYLASSYCALFKVLGSVVPVAVGCFVLVKYFIGIQGDFAATVFVFAVSLVLVMIGFGFFRKELLKFS